jgi:hypothetical protein
MKKFVCENLEELKEFYNEPEEGERVSSEERDIFYKAGKEGFEGKQSFTREELVSLLEDLYTEVAGSYNDYGKNSQDYQEIAIKDVQKFLTQRGF